MPNKNGTGPNGQGPKTGRGLGNCSTKDKTEEPKEIGMGRGMGRGKQCPRKGRGLGNN